MKPPKTPPKSETTYEFQRDEPSRYVVKFKADDKNDGDVIILEGPQALSLDEMIRTWRITCNYTIGLLAFNLAIGVAGTAAPGIHGVVSLAFVLLVHFFAYHSQAKPFFYYELKVFPTRIEASEQAAFQKKFRKFIVSEHFSAKKLISGVPIWLFGYIYLGFVTACGMGNWIIF